MSTKRTLAALCLCACLLAGCTAPLNMRTEDLLVAPRLNQRQTEIYQALETIMDLSAVQYRYPQRGEHRTPFVLYDLDGDEQPEAIVFYAFENDEDNVRAKILKMDEQGSWHSAQDITSRGNDQVEFIEFANLISDDWQCMVIGWQNTRRGTSTLGVYSFADGQYRQEAELSYHAYSIDNYLGDTLQEIALVSLDSSDTYRLGIMGRTLDGRLSSVGDIQLSPDVNSVLQLKCGRLWDGLNAVYVDELRTDTFLATEIVIVEEAGLTMLVGESADVNNYRETRRSQDDMILLCEDLTGTGVVEIPTLSELPWTLDSEELPPPALIQYIRVEPDESFVYSSRAVRNEKSGYMFFFPDAWIDEDNIIQVTVLRRPESNEWRFYKVDPDFDSATVELLRIQVYSTRDYRDQFSEGFLLAEKGVSEYYAYLPRTAENEPLALSEAQVRQHFVLI